MLCAGLQREGATVRVHVRVGVGVREAEVKARWVRRSAAS